MQSMNISMAMHSCGEQPEPKMLTNPVVVIEVLFPGTEKRDKGPKFKTYKVLASLQEYVLVGRLSRLQSRKVKGSNNRKKAQRTLARQHARIAHIRKDALHKATSAIVARTKPESERPSCIVLEDLNVSGMLKRLQSRPTMLPRLASLRA